MFKHILVPTDGSEISHAAAVNAVALARATGAQLTAFHVEPAYRFDLKEDQVPHDFVSPEDYAQRVAQKSQPHLDDVRRVADAAGVTCYAHYAMNDSPAEAIATAVERYGCDAIVMGSHARTGLKKLLMGSETERVLVSVRVPVLVTH